MAASRNPLYALTEGMTAHELLDLISVALARRVNEKKPINWTLVKHECAKCGHKGPVDPDFGVREVKGMVRKQSWCKRCRAGTAAQAS